MTVVIKGTIFQKPGKFGDFNWMISRPEYNDALFIFNDNVEDHHTNKLGGGNAIVRPYNKYGNGKIRSAGIPTGSKGNGFRVLNQETKKIIDDAILEIKDIIKNDNTIKTVYYSKNPGTFLVGTGLFTVNIEVIKYITKCILELNK